jgi:hypothetical protein
MATIQKNKCKNELPDKDMLSSSGTELFMHIIHQEYDITLSARANNMHDSAQGIIFLIDKCKNSIIQSKTKLEYIG